MKLFGKIEDGAIDNLLRAHLSRLAVPSQECPEFDPDLANAYIDRGLTPPLQARFELHLSECAACRKGVVSLSRLAEADTRRPAFPALREARMERASRLARLLGGLSRPQWAMAATAALVLAVSVPVFLSLNRTESQRAAQAVQSPPEQQARPEGSSAQPAEPTHAATLKQPSVDSAASGPATEKPSETPEAEELAKKSPGRQDANAALASQSSPEAAQKLQARGATESFDQIQSKSESQPASQVPAQAGSQALGEARGARDDADRSRQQGKDAPAANEGKAAAADQETADKERARRAEEVAPPPPASRPEADRRSNRELRRPSATHALRDGAASEAVKPPEKRVSGKKFLFMTDTWVDKDFSPDKALPVVTIIRDSNVYKEVLGKRAGLKPYLTAFSGTERAIIVYKGTVYKLIPPETN